MQPRYIYREIPDVMKYYACFFTNIMKTKIMLWYNTFNQYLNIMLFHLTFNDDDYYCNYN